MTAAARRKALERGTGEASEKWALQEGTWHGVEWCWRVGDPLEDILASADNVHNNPESGG
jgi:hypothetical protein